ncbi:MAG: SWIM zinc finger family protein, partial [Clostridia bacterium]
STAPIPEEIQTKRDRKAKRENQDGGAAPRPKKRNAAAQTKKLKKQLAGLDMADRMVRELMKAGLHTLAGTAVKTYENLAKELGNYYLPGPQLFIMRLVQQMQLLQANPEGEAAHFQNASTILVQLASTIKKARVYL